MKIHIDIVNIWHIRSRCLPNIFIPSYSSQLLSLLCSLALSLSFQSCCWALHEMCGKSLRTTTATCAYTYTWPPSKILMCHIRIKTIILLNIWIPYYPMVNCMNFKYAPSRTQLSISILRLNSIHLTEIRLSKQTINSTTANAICWFLF